MVNVEEVLNILQEECAEVIQMVSKCRRFGIDNIHIKSERTNREKLTEEIGDMLCMIDLLVDEGVLTIADLNHAKAQKFEKLQKWSRVFPKDGDKHE